MGSGCGLSACGVVHPKRMRAAKQNVKNKYAANNARQPGATDLIVGEIVGDNAIMDAHEELWTAFEQTKNQQ